MSRRGLAAPVWSDQAAVHVTNEATARRQQPQRSKKYALWGSAWWTKLLFNLVTRSLVEGRLVDPVLGLQLRRMVFKF